MIRMLFVWVLIASLAHAQPIENRKYGQEDAFRQLEELLPTPNDYRTASGAPGSRYWQQQVDYLIDVSLDEQTRRITGSERITYHNNSPDTLDYLWVQIDNNWFAPDADSALIEAGGAPGELSFDRMRSMLARREFDGSVTISRVADAQGHPLAHTINKTMMRVDLPEPLPSGASFTFEIDWSYVVNDSREVRARTAAEYFEDDGNWIFEMAHWFPRLAKYSDVEGWHNKQFLGRGEFTLEFGDYEVRITVPADHIVAATGVLQNPGEVLTRQQRERLAQARSSDRPVYVVTPEEAVENQSQRDEGTKTWVFRAENVRDFAWASSRKFIWDAMGVRVGDNEVLAMSFWPIEGEPLWSRYSTHAIAHTLEVYSKFTFDYPYPVAISVNGPVGGMEYPMICFNGPRPEADGTYSARTKYGLISVIIHEVGHNWFPMIVNSDERQWTWMDEGLNTFCQYLAEQEWEEGYPSRRGEPRDITGYMTSTNQVPIMTNSESLLQFGANAYAKPATALNILRETVMGRSLFDTAFRTYARRWMFKHPRPADFFRSMEDASAVDLDWFWRGWFYTTDHVDIAVKGLTHLVMDTGDPEIEKQRERERRAREPESLSEIRNRELVKRTERYPELLDFYNEYDELEVQPTDLEQFEEMFASLEPWQRELLSTDLHFAVVDLENIGGLVMPVILELHFEDGTTQEMRIPAEIWRQNNRQVSKLLITPKKIVKIVLDPHLETADADLSNNAFPPEPAESRFKLFKREREKNPMQKVNERK